MYSAAGASFWAVAALWAWAVYAGIKKYLWYKREFKSSGFADTIGCLALCMLVFFLDAVYWALFYDAKNGGPISLTMKWLSRWLNTDGYSGFVVKNFTSPSWLSVEHAVLFISIFGLGVVLTKISRNFDNTLKILESAIYHLRIPMMLLDNKGKVWSVNTQAISAVSGKSSDEAIGKIENEFGSGLFERLIEEAERHEYAHHAMSKEVELFLTRLHDHKGTSLGYCAHAVISGDDGSDMSSVYRNNFTNCVIGRAENVH